MALLIVLAVIIFIRKYVKNDGIKEKSKKTAQNQKKNEKSDYTIELQGDEVVNLVLGDEYQDLGVVVKDVDGNVVDAEVDVKQDEFNTAGEHTIIYTVVDEKGRKAQAERTVSIAPNLEYETSGLPVCMYHYVYEASNPPDSVDANFIEVSALEEELKYLKDNDYYFPTWEEVREYLDGERLLPEKSIVLTFDDGPSYITLAIPLFEKYQITATSFVITNYYDSKEMLDGYASDYLNFESHSHNMHRGGGSGQHGGIFPSMSYDEAMADLQQSIEFCGSNDAFAYPFGDYTESCEKILEEAGFLCAVTTEAGKCYPGDDPYALPRVRMSGEQSLDSFAGKIQ